MKKKLFFACLLWINTTEAKTFLISANINHVSAKEKEYSGAEPGDTLLLEAGIRSAIQFADFTGSSTHYITIMNAPGVCEIKTSTLPYGMSLRNCHYIRLCGQSQQKSKYGISISQVSMDGAGLGISDKSDHIEVCHIEICNTKGPGILCKTNPDCVTDRDNYTMFKTSIHNNYIHNTGTEGMYIGSTAYEGTEINCGSGKVKKYPPVLDSVEVYENEVSHTGWDGIQISNAAHVKCYRNTISFDSEKDEPWQNCGLIIGGGTSGEFYENLIEHGKGYAVNCFGIEHVSILSNTIVMDSSNTKVAIYINDKLADNTTYYSIYRNNIQTRHYPAITIINKKGRKPDWVKENNLQGADLNQAITYEGVKPFIK